jgi:hypothetical protein
MLVSLAWPEARSGPATPGDPPDAVKQAIAKAAKDKITDEPAKVVVGAYINDPAARLQEQQPRRRLLCLVSLEGRNIDPSKTMEFMNRYALDDA